LIHHSKVQPMNGFFDFLIRIPDWDVRTDILPCMALYRLIGWS
jgi:hypothetical protein